MYYTDDVSHLILPPEKDWMPVFWTPMLSEKSLGYDIIKFAETYMEPPRGGIPGEKVKLTDYQKWLLIHMFELDENGYFRYTEIYLQLARKHGKSFIGSIIAAYFGAKGKNGDEIYIAAKDSKQAEVVFKEIANNIQGSPELSQVFRVNKDVIQNEYFNVNIRKLSSNAQSTFGLAPYISICDELWCWDSETGRSTKGQDMITSLTTGSGDRKEHICIEITTAGSNLEGLAYARYDKGKQIATGGLEDKRFGFFCWEAEEHDPIDDPKTWRKANPNIGAGLMSEEKFAEDYHSAAQIDTTDFERFRLNKWIRRGDSEGYINAFHWDNAGDPTFGSISEGAEITVGFDGSLTDDSTGFVGLDIATGMMEVLYKWEQDRTNKSWFVDVEEVKAAMVDIQKRFDVKMVYADPSRHQEVIKTWIRDYGRTTIRDIPPSPARMFPMCEEFREDLYKGELKHNADKRFREHVLNAVTSIRGLPKKDKPDSPLKIDFLICAVLANGARRELQDKQRRIDATKARYR